MGEQGINWDAVITFATIAIAVWLLLGNVLAWLWRTISPALLFVYYFVTDEGAPKAPAPARVVATSTPERLDRRSAWDELDDTEAAPAADVLSVLDTSLHALLIGYSGGGKTTMMHELAQRWTQRATVLVCDPDAAPGLWAGCDVAGAGDDFEGISTALERVGRLVKQRRKLRAAGVRQFDSLYVCIDEYQDVARNVESARATVEDVLRRGRKLGVHLVIGVQDKAVKTLGFEGQGDLRKNFTWVAELRQRADGSREARVQANGEGGWVAMPVPELPDLDVLIDQAGAMDGAMSGAMEGRYSAIERDIAPHSSPAEDSIAGRSWEDEVRERAQAGDSTRKILRELGGDYNEIVRLSREAKQAQEA